MWIAVFKTGRHTDSKGSVREWTDGDLDNIAAKYDPKTHEAPVVIGHPKDNAPAYGWVESLKRTGDTLWAEIKPTVAEFAGWLKAGLFKKRSISLYPDMSLRHIGFLGAQPPAVKGLPDFAFNDPEAAVIEFASDVMPEDSNRASTLTPNANLDSRLRGNDDMIWPDEGKMMLDSRLRGNDDKNYTEVDDKAAQEARSKVHGIGIKEGGNVTKPGKYADVPDDEFGDPVNFRYPLDEDHIHAALAYWAKAHNREQYSKEEVTRITDRILAAAKKHGVDVDKEKFQFSEPKGGSMNFWEELKNFLKGKGIEVDSDRPGAFSEADVKAAVATAVEKAKEEIERGFAEMDSSFAKKESALKAKEAELIRLADEARKKEVADFCESLKRQGKLVPAMEKLGMGITGFMQAIAGIETAYEFAEASEDGKKATERPLEFMQAFLARLPRAIEFAEVATDEEDPGGGDMDAKRERAIRKHMDDHKMDYKDAMLAVSKKRPELFGRGK